LLLIMLWLRSYWWFDMKPYIRFGHLSSAKGMLYLSQMFSVPEGIADETFCYGFWKMPFDSRQTVVPTGIPGWALPYWSLVVLTLAISMTSWLPWEFSLRTLLIATTLIAIVLGLAVWANR
jgi:hypothetical protein